MDKKAFLRFILLPPLVCWLVAFGARTASVFMVCRTLASSEALRARDFMGGGVRLPVSVTVFGRGADTISARVGFSTPSGDPVGTIERSWNGWSLTMDCLALSLPFRTLGFRDFFHLLVNADVPADGRGASTTLVFPVLLYADDSDGKSAFSLPPYYDRDGFPALYLLPGISEKEKRALSGAFRLAKWENAFPGCMKTFSRKKLKIRSFEPGVEYNLLLESDGGVSLVR